MSLVAVLIACMLLPGAAGAASQSSLLPRVFPLGAPPAVENLLVRDALTDAREGLKLTVNEHLYDGRNIHLNWTVESEREDAVYYLTTYQLWNADGTPMEISYWSYRGGSVDTDSGCLIALNAMVDDSATAKTFEGEISNGFLPDEVPNEPWSITLDIHAYTTDLRPVPYMGDDYIGDMAMTEAEALQSRGEIAILDMQYSGIMSYPKYRAIDNGEYWNRAERVRRIIDAHNTCGLLTPLAQLSMTVPIDVAGTEHVPVSRISAPTELAFKALSMTFDQFEINLFGIYTEYRVPMEQLGGNDHFELGDAFLILDQDGNSINWAFGAMSNIWYPDQEAGSERCMHISQGGRASIELPTSLTFIVADEEMRNLIWNGKYEEALAYIDAHPALRDEATLTLKRGPRGD